MLYLLTHFQTKLVLERHLIISDQVFTMAELRARTSNNSVVLPTYRDALALRVREDEKRKLIKFSFYSFFT